MEINEQNHKDIVIMFLLPRTSGRTWSDNGISHLHFFFFSFLLSAFKRNVGLQSYNNDFYK